MQINQYGFELLFFFSIQRAKKARQRANIVSVFVVQWIVYELHCRLRAGDIARWENLKQRKQKKNWSSRFTLYLIIAFFISITFEAAARVCGWMTAMCTYVNDTHSYEAHSTSRFFMSCLYFCAFFFGRHRIRIAVNKMVKTIILSKKCEQSSGLVYTA